MGKIIAITSGKGGTGKTSFTAGVGVALALQRKKVLCIDLDLGMTNLDLSLGMSDRALMDFCDVAHGRCELTQAATMHLDIPYLYLLTAPRYRHDKMEEEDMVHLAKTATRLFDYVLLDAPAGIGHGFRLATVAAATAVVVTTNDASALRDGRRVVEELNHVPRIMLAMNRIQPKLMKKLGDTIDDCMDSVGLPLIGVIPEDQRVTISANQGRPLVQEGKSGAARAYYNIARRLMGYNTPLMTFR